MEEIWKDIEGYEGYQISNMGRVRSLKYNKERFLRERKIKTDYLRVSLCKNGVAREFYIHRLVAQAFLPNPDNLPQVNHKDEDKTNNHVSNLEWCTIGYNINYGSRNEKDIRLKGKPVLALKEGKICMYFKSTHEVAIKGFDQSSVNKCCNSKMHYNTHKGYQWQYVEDYLADWWDKEMDKHIKEKKRVA